MALSAQYEQHKTLAQQVLVLPNFLVFITLVAKRTMIHGMILQVKKLLLFMLRKSMKNCQLCMLGSTRIYSYCLPITIRITCTIIRNPAHRISFHVWNTLKSVVELYTIDFIFLRNSCTPQHFFPCLCLQCVRYMNLLCSIRPCINGSKLLN